MKDFVVILASTTSTSITNPHYHHYHYHQHGHRRRYASDSSLNHSSGPPLGKSAPTSHSVPLIFPSRSFHISSTVRWDSDTCQFAGDGGLGEHDVEVVARGILQDVESGNVESVIEVLRRIDDLGIRSASLFDESLMKSLRKQFRRMVNCGELEETIRLMEILAGFQFKIKELVDPFDVIKSCIDNCNSDLAIRYACLMPHAQLLFCKIIQEIGKRGDMVSVMAAYEAIKENIDAPNMYLYRTLIDVCGLCGDYMKSRYIYEDILSQNTTPNIYVVNSLMNVNSHDLGYTLDVYKNMQKLGIPADIASYNILLKSCCLAGRVDLARDIYKEAKRLESAGGLKLDAFTYCTIIKVFADAKLWKLALKVKEDMLTAGVTPNTFTWSSLISACANAGLVEQALVLFEEMLQAGCEPNSQCFNVVLHACVEAYQYDRAFRLFHSWKGSLVQASGDQSRNQPYSSSGQINKHGVIPKLNSGSGSHNMRFPKRFSFTPTTATYNILLRACGTDYYRAKALLDEMKTLGLSPNHISWSTLMNVCGCSGDVQGAVQILRAMHTAEIKPDVVAYTTAIKVCVEGKRLKLAFSLFEEMRKYQIKPNLVTYNTLLRARSRYGSLFEVRQCLAIYQDMRRAGYKPNDYYLKQLIEEWCEGVILEDGQNRDEIRFYKGADSGRPQSLLIEKVAQHLQENSAESFAIDVQGLTKVEARIVVLAVLRMIKESYIQGDAVKDDVSIIVGTGGDGVESAKHEIAVKNALIELMRDELGLEVLAAVPNNLDKNLKEDLTSTPPSSTRRPAFLQRLKVPKKCLHKWLQQRLAAPIRRS